MRGLKKLLLVAVLFVGSNAAFAAPAGNFGAGIVLGEPTGISGKYWLNRIGAIDAALAYAFNDYLVMDADYVHHFPGVLDKAFPGADLTPYVGLGLVMGFSTKDRNGETRLGAGVRIPLGLELLFSHKRLGLFFEVAPGITIAPSTDFLVEGGVGIRYFF